ncbi:MAG: SUMF1/EgtB/PvdO family nonheme iron enzyme [Deltaproteobacteria bacterium]|nr:SUMF1/EgtB/PvdO family nonheme iron enzyme [Deltaproteobacteria bacterium]
MGSFPSGAGRWSHLDLGGNVWEWTSSGHSSSYSVSRNNSARIARGGCWYFDDASFVRSALRYGDDPANRNGYLGFRCAGSAALP